MARIVMVNSNMSLEYSISKSHLTEIENAIEVISWITQGNIQLGGM